MHGKSEWEKETTPLCHAHMYIAVPLSGRGGGCEETLCTHWGELISWPHFKTEREGEGWEGIICTKLYRRSTNNSNGGMLKIVYINKPQTGYIIMVLTHALNTYSHKQELHVDIEDRQTDRHTHTHTHKHAYTHALTSNTWEWKLGIQYVHALQYNGENAVHKHTHTHIHTHTQPKHKCIHTQTHMYVCTHTHTHTNVTKHMRLQVLDKSNWAFNTFLCTHALHYKWGMHTQNIILACIILYMHRVQIPLAKFVYKCELYLE